MQVKKAKGAILVKSRQPLVVDEFDLPETLLPGHVLVKIHHTSICGAQINEIDAVKGVDKFLPHLLGHEASGTVVEVGPGVTTKKAGDTVVLHWRPSQGIQSAPPAYMWRGNKLNAGWVTTFNESRRRLGKSVDRHTGRFRPQDRASARLRRHHRARRREQRRQDQDRGIRRGFRRRRRRDEHRSMRPDGRRLSDRCGRYHRQEAGHGAQVRRDPYAEFTQRRAMSARRCARLSAPRAPTRCSRPPAARM